jgi:hypothetical protein
MRMGLRAAGLVRAGDSEGSFKDGGEKKNARLAVTDEARESGQGRRGRRPAGEPPAIGSNPADGSETWAATGPNFLLSGLSREFFLSFAATFFCPR